MRVCIHVAIVGTFVWCSLAPDCLGRTQGRGRDPSTIRGIVIHTIGGPSCIRSKIEFRPIPVRSDDAAFWQKYLLKAPVADAHFVIGRRGEVAPVIPVGQIANHALGVNEISIGIELVHRGDGKEPFEPAQISSLIAKIKELRHEFPSIAIHNIVAHSDVDQQTCPCGGATYNRRQDPGANFPMDAVRKAVQEPNEPPGDATPPLPRLTGASAKIYCPIF